MSAQPYMIDGRRVPSVTSIVSQIGWNRDALIAWSNRIGREGKTLAEGRDQAAGVGTIAHALVQGFLKNEPISLDGIEPEMAAQAQKSFEGWRDWWQSATREVIACEKPFTSRSLMCGGTPDIIYRGSEGVVLLDNKTGAGIYPEALVQVAGYALIVAEHGIAIDRIEIGRFDRDTGSRTIKSLSHRGDSPASKAFLAGLLLHGMQGQLKKEAK